MESDDFLLNKLEKVSLIDTTQNEWWVLRRVPSTITNSLQEQEEIDKCEAYNKSYVPPSYKSRYSDILDESSYYKNSTDSFNKHGKRLSDVNVSKIGSKRISVDSDSKSETNKVHFSEFYYYIFVLFLNSFVYSWF